MVNEVIVHQRTCGVSPHCLMWTICRDKNASCFEAQQGHWKSSKSCLSKLCFIGPLLFKCLSFPLSQFVFTFLLFPLWGLSLYTSYVLGLHPSTLFNELLISPKKEKEKERQVGTIFHTTTLRGLPEVH